MMKKAIFPLLIVLSLLVLETKAEEFPSQFEAVELSATLEAAHEGEESPAPSASPQPIAGMSGIVSISPWHQKPAGKDAETNLKARFRVDGWLNVTADGCLKVRARLTTGEKFNNEWINTGIGTNDQDFKVALRDLYVSATCLKKITIEAGAIPVRSFGNMGLSDIGSIDGIQAVIPEEKHKREWTVSMGNVDTEASFYDRDFSGINHFSVQVLQTFTPELKGYVSFASRDEKTFERVGLQWVVTQYISWLKEVGGDVLASDGRFLGVDGFVRFDVKKWNTRIAYTSVDATPTEEDRLAFLMKQFFGYGKNLYLETSRDFSKNLSLSARLRVGEAGPLANTAITWKFSADKNKKSKPKLTP